jgi:hypothetical protein
MTLLEAIRAEVLERPPFTERETQILAGCLELIDAEAGKGSSRADKQSRALAARLIHFLR